MQTIYKVGLRISRDKPFRGIRSIYAQGTWECIYRVHETQRRKWNPFFAFATYEDAERYLVSSLHMPFLHIWRAETPKVLWTPASVPAAGFRVQYIWYSFWDAYQDYQRTSQFPPALADTFRTHVDVPSGTVLCQEITLLENMTVPAAER